MAKLVLEILDYDQESNFYTHFCFDEFESKEALSAAIDIANRETPVRIKAAQDRQTEWVKQNPPPIYGSTKLSGPEFDAFVNGPYRLWEKNRPKLETAMVSFYGATFTANGYGASGHREFKIYTLEEWFEKEATERKNQIKVAI